MLSITPPTRFGLAQLKRSRVVLATIALLLVLDVGRSINARVGYANPVSVWQPPAPYASASKGVVRAGNGFGGCLRSAQRKYLYFKCLRL